MNFIKNMNIIEQACTQFLEPHPCFYNLPLEITPTLKNYPQLALQVIDLELQSGFSQESQKHSTKLNLIRNKWNSQNCLVYLHGLSSYCLQGKFLIPLLADNLSLCLFDARAHGKNRQKFVSYGLLQSQELYDIVRYLIKSGFKNIILWGRSMGAVTCLKLLQRLKGCQMIENIKYVVADSPFCSFKTIATQIISRKTHIPEFISSVFADAFVEKIRQKHGINLSLLDLQQLSTVVPINFLYSSSDELMSIKHIENIVKNNQSNFQVNDIKVLHNEERPSWIVAKIMAKIRQQLSKNKPVVLSFNQSKKRGLSITKFCAEPFSYPKTPNPFSKSQIRTGFTSKYSKKSMTKREIMSELYGEYKQNVQSFKKDDHKKAKVELGGSKIELVLNRLLPQKKQRKITVSQFFIEN